jgi:hypothetical protein
MQAVTCCSSHWLTGGFSCRWGERPLLVVVMKPHVEQEKEHEAIKEELYK